MTQVPSFPSATVEFNVLHDALEAGDDPKLAAAKAVAAGRGETIEDGTKLSGKSKTDLLKIAKAEKVTLGGNETVPEIITAIEAARISILMGETGVVEAPPATTSRTPDTDTTAPDGADGA